VDGQPVGGGDIAIPIVFKGQLGSGPPPGSRYKELLVTPWSAAPTAAEMTAAYPKSAIGHVAAGHVVLTCGLYGDGTIRFCDTVTENPPNQGFDEAARTLIKKFKVGFDPTAKLNMHDYLVSLPFDFRDPTQASPPVEMTDPVWVKQIAPDAALKMFPEAAAKAGYKTGMGMVSCQVTHAGTLSGCVVVKEDPPGVGFGETALTIAQMMAMNLWTQQGTPVEGAHIRIPIRLNLPDDAPVPAPATP
jgi:hypothetical protein